MLHNFLAHIAPDGRLQTVETHLRTSADYARHALAGTDLQEIAYLAALVHDIGKMTLSFSEYLQASAAGQAVRRGSVNHSFAGARYILKKVHTSSDAAQKIASEYIAYAIGAHHGLFDCFDENGASGFDRRCENPDPVIEEALLNFSKTRIAEEIDTKISEAGQKLLKILKRFQPPLDPYFLRGLVCRLILSAVIEGDRRDTAEFMMGLPPQMADVPDWEQCLRHLESKLAGFENASPIGRARERISVQCKAAAECEPDIFRLNVPTGGGKTLSSLRFALRHAQKWQKKRIIYVIPLLTIIEQNADVIRDALGDTCSVLEHHSNAMDSDDGAQEAEPCEILTDAWDASVIITTQVQFLNTLFSHKTTSIRRFHSLIDSIIILDEVQSVPNHMLSLFNHAMVFLREVCHATIVLCSATQPALNLAQRKSDIAPKDMVPHDAQLWEIFRRTEIINGGSMTMEEIADFAQGKIETVGSLLIICNTKREAAFLYQQLCESDVSCFHLSTNLCIAHRRETLRAVIAAKQRGRVICVSTQMIEAGVDISFACVIRLQAGMDSIVQAAGRCNRNRESEQPADVYVISCIGERLDKLRSIQEGKTATESLFALRDRDFTSDAAIKQYYGFLYNNQSSGYQDFYCKDLRANLFDLLGKNTKYMTKASPYFLNQAFKTAAEHFKVFDDNTIDILVPYGEGKHLQADLRSGQVRFDLKHLKSLLDRIKPYMISVFQYQKDALIKAHGLELLPCGVWVLDGSWYDGDALGLLNEPRQEFLEV